MTFWVAFLVGLTPGVLIIAWWERDNIVWRLHQLSAWVEARAAERRRWKAKRDLRQPPHSWPPIPQPYRDLPGWGITPGGLTRSRSFGSVPTIEDEFTRRAIEAIVREFGDDMIESIRVETVTNAATGERIKVSAQRPSAEEEEPVEPIEEDRTLYDAKRDAMSGRGYEEDSE